MTLQRALEGDYLTSWLHQSCEEGLKSRYQRVFEDFKYITRRCRDVCSQYASSGFVLIERGSDVEVAIERRSTVKMSELGRQ
jgi:hypothetical protein